MRSIILGAGIVIVLQTTLAALPADAAPTPQGTLNAAADFISGSDCSVVAPTHPIKSAQVTTTAKTVKLKGTWTEGRLGEIATDTVHLSTTSTLKPTLTRAKALKSLSFTGTQQLTFARSASTPCASTFRATTSVYYTVNVKKAGKISVTWKNSAPANLYEAVVYDADGKPIKSKIDLPSKGSFKVPVVAGTYSFYFQVNTTIKESQVKSGKSRKLNAPYNLSVGVK